MRPAPEPQSRPVAPSRQARLLVPRHIAVIRDDRSPDTFLRMEIDNETTYMVPIGPRLVANLIEGLDRARRLVAPPAARQ